jgi:hypothetical protein
LEWHHQFAFETIFFISSSLSPSMTFSTTVVRLSRLEGMKWIFGCNVSVVCSTKSGVILIMIEFVHRREGNRADQLFPSISIIAVKDSMANWVRWRIEWIIRKYAS